MLSEYRQSFEAFHTEIYREDFLLRSGKKNNSDISSIYREYSDLFSLSVVAELRAALAETAVNRATEREAIKRLIAFALENNLRRRVSDLADEIAANEAAARIQWKGSSIELRQVDALLASEPDTDKRRELQARRAEAIKDIRDLSAELFERLHEGAEALGFENLTVMRRELCNVDGQKVAGLGAKLLSQTERGYVTALAPLTLKQSGVSIDAATLADLPRIKNFTRFDHLFTRGRMLNLYRELFFGLGFSTYQQANVELDSGLHPGRQPNAFCSPIKVPEQIKLSFPVGGGQQNYAGLLGAAGRAQHLAWTSGNLHPEFRLIGFGVSAFGADVSAHLAWGMLIENLMLDPAWLAASFNLVESSELRHARSVFRLMAVRAAAALLNYEVELYSRKASGSDSARYAELMSYAVRVRFDGTWSPADLCEHSLQSADFMRACVFESQLREHLKTRFGTRWWDSRKAGEILIDLWNTGQRYSVESLAEIIGLGALDFEWLADELVQQIR